MEYNRTDTVNESNTPPFTIEYLDSFEKKVVDNTATLRDYNEFITNIKPFGLSLLLESEMKKYDVYGIEQFIKERNKDKSDPTRNRYVDTGIIGIFKGMIKALRNIIK